ncbi:nose resistant to fluoxetine protein 6-like [Coccinella septempunctata]|uniref:nose resistant to fluoxetine protein 6-like n=1 Tax=Coccinella septempunctata TaxID=41139 RepID=UPI001D098CB2|nr:nose resistant to fluoxetine protein 6-like [Coccinella septempunctata]
MKTSKLQLLIFAIFFGNAIALDLQLLLNNETVNPLDFLIPTVDAENEKCREHSLLYKEELSKFTVWATDMFDASTKFPSGIFFGSIFDTGNFDECIKVHLPEEIGFSGQHCMAHFKIKPLSPVKVGKGHELEYDLYENIFNITTWHKITKYAQDGSKQSRDEVYYTFCIPSSCTYKDLEDSLKAKINLLKDFLPFSLHADVNPMSCQVEREFNFDTADYLFMGIVGGFITFGVIATLYHLITKLEGMSSYRLSGKAHDVLQAFSYSHTIKKMASESSSEDGMECMHGMKTISMFLIIMGHRIMFSVSSPVGNPIFVESIYRKAEFSALLNGPIVVDTFFTISGFLACYLILLEIEKRQKMINVLMIYVHRFIRLTPAYAVVLAFYCTIFVQMGDGPFWQERIGVEQERCLNTWWANLFYLNNYIKNDQMCMFQSWYLTCDTHYFLLVPFAAYLLWKKPKVGVFFCSIIILVAVVVPFIVIYREKEEPFLLLYMKLLRDPVANKTFQSIYTPSHMRMSPYFIGVLGGYLKFRLRKSGAKLPNHIVYPTWVVGFIVAFSIIFTGFLFYIPTEHKDYLLSSLYGSLHHFLWSACMTMLIILVSEGYGAWFAPFLNWRPWALLGRITYTAYLSQGAVLLYTAGITRSPVYTGMFNLFNFTASDIVLSYVAGFCLSLVFESPFIQLEKIILRGTSGQSDKQVETKKKEKKGVRNEGFVDIYIPKITTLHNTDKGTDTIPRNRYQERF